VQELEETVLVGGNIFLGEVSCGGFGGEFGGAG
jgi:hypothetical protein